MAVYYLDTSALAKVYHEELGSQRVGGLVRERGRRLLISRLAVVEMHSVFAIKARSNAISPSEADFATSGMRVPNDEWSRFERPTPCAQRRSSSRR